jgi:hypothetical protein
LTDRVVLELTAGLKGTRSYSYGGVLKEWHKQAKEERAKYVEEQAGESKEQGNLVLERYDWYLDNYYKSSKPI